MAFNIVSQARLKIEIIKRVGQATKSWVKGFPINEEPFMNRITERLINHKPNCNVGTNGTVPILTRLHKFHRMQNGRSDLHGLDFGFTLDLSIDGFRKSAFFQLKIAKKGKITIEKTQLLKADGNPLTKPVSFVMGACAYCNQIRIGSVPTLLKQFQSHSAATKKLSITTLTAIDVWLDDWLSCQVGGPNTCSEEDLLLGMLRSAPELADTGKPHDEGIERAFTKIRGLANEIVPYFWVDSVLKKTEQSSQ